MQRHHSPGGYRTTRYNLFQLVEDKIVANGTEAAPITTPCLIVREGFERSGNALKFVHRYPTETRDALRLVFRHRFSFHSGNFKYKGDEMNFFRISGEESEKRNQ